MAVSQDYGAVFFEPFWPTNGFGWPGAVPAGVTHVTSPAHPFAAIGERYVRFDGNSAVHRQYVIGTGVAADNDSESTTTRVAFRYSCLFRTSATAPATDAVLIEAGAAGAIKVYETTGRKVRLDISGVTYQISTASLPTATDIQLELWAVRRDSAGNSIDPHQYVVRYIDLTTFAATTLISVTGPVVIVTTADVYMGENTARGAGYEFFAGTFYAGSDNADSPRGVIRIDRLDPNGLSALLNQWTATASADVDDSGTAVPDDATTEDRTLAMDTTTTPDDQAYTLSAPALAVAADTVFRVCVLLRGKLAGGGSKSSVETIAPLITDGTTAKYGNPTTMSPVTVWINTSQSKGTFHLAPGGGAWAHGDLAALEAGVRAETSVVLPAQATMANTVVTTMVAYVKSGEGTVALPYPPPLAGVTLMGSAAGVGIV